MIVYYQCSKSINDNESLHLQCFLEMSFNNFPRQIIELWNTCHAIYIEYPSVETIREWRQKMLPLCGHQIFYEANL